MKTLEAMQNEEPRDLRPLFHLPDRVALAETMGDKALAALLAEADEITAGKVRLFGGEPLPLRMTWDAPLVHWTQYEIHPSLLGEGTDLKFTWELARFGLAYTLGRAYHVTGEDRYAAAFWRYFEEFSEANPAYLGPQWMNGQEVALRLMAFVWSAKVCADAPSSTPERTTALARAVALHAARIPHTLIYARSQNNNHLVTEAAGLFTAGLALKHSEWRDLGWCWLNWALQNQIGADGEYIQHSTNYQRVMLDAALWVDAIKDAPWPPATGQALERAAHFLFTLLDPVSGNVPNTGANDGALIQPLSSAVNEDFRSVVQAAALAFLHTQISSGLWDETSLWLGFTPEMRTVEPGYYLGDILRGRDSWAYLRASQFKSRLGHMDQLHFDLWWRGLNITPDAGTYLYNAAPPWDNPLVSTRVHNTVTVDGRDQMTRGGRFLVLDWFPAFSKAVSESDPTVLQKVTAWHDGYPGIRHERNVTIFADGRWLVEDRLTPRRASLHSYRLHWLLPHWPVEVSEGEPLMVRLRSPNGTVTLSLSGGPATPQMSIVRAGELVHGRREFMPWEGWVSPIYGVKIRALSLAVEISTDQPVTFTTEFHFPS